MVATGCFLGARTTYGACASNHNSEAVQDEHLFARFRLDALVVLRRVDIQRFVR